jgi:hypothetical protein
VRAYTGAAMRRWLGLLSVVVALAACGGGGEDAKAVKANVERFFASDPRGCTLETEQMVRNTQDAASTDEAIASCRRREQQRQAGGDAGTPFAPSRGAAVSGVEVDGAKATAEATLQGGDLNGQKLAVGLVKQGDVWKIARIDGLTIDARLRAKYDSAFAPNVRTALKGKVPDDRVDPAVACIVQRFAAAVPNDRLADQYEGKLAPGTLSKAGEEAAQACLATSSQNTQS